MGTYSQLAELSKRRSVSPTPVSDHQLDKQKGKVTDENSGVTIPRYHDTMKPRNRGTVIPQTAEDMIEFVRKTVKEFGKEAATHRFTLAEKRAIADIIYAYKQRGVKTSENEIARIAINFVVRDYEQNGDGSVLSRVIRVLNE